MTPVAELFGPGGGNNGRSAGGPPCRTSWFAVGRARPVYLGHAKAKRPFVVEIEAKLTVHAFDEDSARKKVEKAFASGRVLGLDVSAGAGVWTYAVVPQLDAPAT